MSMYENFQTDPDLEKNGIFHDYGEFRVKVARAGGANKKFARRLEFLTRPFQRAMQTGTMDPEVSLQLLRKAYAQANIREWERKNEDGTWRPAIEAPDGTDLEVNEENLIATFERLPDLFLDLKAQAESSALYRAALRAEASENS